MHSGQQHDDLTLQIAVEEFYNGQMGEHMGYEASEPLYLSKQTPQQQHYDAMAAALYRTRPVTTDRQVTQCYLAGIAALCEVWEYDPYFNRGRFLDRAALTEINGYFELLPF